MLKSFLNIAVAVLVIVGVNGCSTVSSIEKDPSTLALPIEGAVVLGLSSLKPATKAQAKAVIIAVSNVLASITTQISPTDLTAYITKALPNVDPTYRAIAITAIQSIYAIEYPKLVAHNVSTVALLRAIGVDLAIGVSLS